MEGRDRKRKREPKLLLPTVFEDAYQPTIRAKAGSIISASVAATQLLN